MAQYAAAVFPDLDAGLVHPATRSVAPTATLRVRPAPEDPIRSLEALLEGVSDPGDMLEYLSIWLTDHSPHDLLAYWNPRDERAHMVCHGRYQECKDLIRAAREVMDSPLPRFRYWRKRGLFFNIWPGFPGDRCDRLLLIERNERSQLEETTLYVERAFRVLAKYWNGPACRIDGWGHTPASK